MVVCAAADPASVILARMATSRVDGRCREFMEVMPMSFARRMPSENRQNLGGFLGGVLQREHRLPRSTSVTPDTPDEPTERARHCVHQR